MYHVTSLYYCIVAALFTRPLPFEGERFVFCISLYLCKVNRMGYITMTSQFKITLIVFLQNKTDMFLLSNTFTLNFVFFFFLEFYFLVEINRNILLRSHLVEQNAPTFCSLP